MYGLPSATHDIDFIEDITELARTASLDLDVLRTRYGDELRPYALRPDRLDTTLEFALGMIAEARSA